MTFLKLQEVLKTKPKLGPGEGSSGGISRSGAGELALKVQVLTGIPLKRQIGDDLVAVFWGVGKMGVFGLQLFDERQATVL